ncbi:flagellar hook-basal body complex protein [Thioclava sp. GXIMD4216]|uniref:Flagellar basal-body rod protein FlgF n=1 Tax=Thioclava litoralis TaxID=3076557 RepID=A0ABZ1DWI6_9RHOB|nr:flagellar hook-basal body complex protein [Thioclava sp. FTW29]
MDNAIYATLTRQSGLMKEMQVVANNIANTSTTGFRKEGVIFAEHVEALGNDEPSLSMALGNGREISTLQGGLTSTGNNFDFAIQGDGYFMVQTPQGDALTRAGNFVPSAEGILQNQDGYPVLDSGGGPIFIPAEGQLSVAQDGTMSVDGQPIAQLGVYDPADPNGMVHSGGTLFYAEGGAQVQEFPQVLQGFVEESNVDPITEVARMIEVQRAYEMGQKFLDREDERIRNVISTLTK